MASFMTDLWESIFTPGTTPTMLKATNMSFAALQFVLFALLLATYSIHCVVLSVLCAGLWWSVNWFAAELALHQAREREREAAAAAKKGGGGGGDPVDDGGNETSETEVDTSQVAVEGGKKKNKKKTAAAAARGGVAAPAPVVAAVEVEPIEVKGELKKRNETPLVTAETIATAPTTGTQSSASTEDEWEKVSENENDKDK